MPKPQITDANFSSILVWNKLKKEILNPWTPHTLSLLKKNPELNEYSMRKTFTEESKGEEIEKKASHARKKTELSEKSFHIENSEHLLGEKNKKVLLMNS